MGTKRVGWARIRSLINENQNQVFLIHYILLTIELLVIIFLIKSFKNIRK